MQSELFNLCLFSIIICKDRKLILLFAGLRKICPCMLPGIRLTHRLHCQMVFQWKLYQRCWDILLSKLNIYIRIVDSKIWFIKRHRNLSLLQFCPEVIDRQPEKSRGCAYQNFHDQNTASRSVTFCLW